MLTQNPKKSPYSKPKEKPILSSKILLPSGMRYVP